MTTNAECESDDAVIVLVQLVGSEGGPTTMTPPQVFLGKDKGKRAERAALALYDADQVSTSFLSDRDADAARERWLKFLKAGRPVPLNCRSSLRWRMVVGER